MSQKVKQSYDFEGYRLDAYPLALWRDGQLISVPPKVLEMLLLLVEKKGEIVMTEELLDKVWPEAHVEEGNIKYTVSLLRKALGKELVQTIPRRGYRFVAKVSDVTVNGNESVSGSETLTERACEPEAAVGVPPIVRHEIPVSRKKPVRILFAALISVALAAAVVVLWRRTATKPVIASNRNIKAIAILPLKSLNDDETSKAVSLGLASSLISRLGSLNRFIVRPLDAVDKYAKDGDGTKVGAELKVDAVLDGTVQLVDKRIRVNVRLIDARDGGQIWTASFVESKDDLFKLQDKLANHVANSLVTRITDQEQSLLVTKYTENAEAYRAYARGRAILKRKNLDLLDKAINEFQQSITIDPAFALAYAGLADAFLAQGNLLTGAEADVPFNKARLYAQKALQLGEESAEIFTALGRVKRIKDWDWPGAERDFNRAIQLNPNHSEAHRFLAQMLSFLGRHDEAIAEINRALEINPISPAITQAQFSILESRGDYSEALKRAEEFYGFDKENPGAKRALALFLFHTGEHARVIELCEHLTARDERQKFAFLSLLSAAYRKTNQPEKADETLRQLEQLAQTDTKALYSLAMNYAELGRTDDAMWALQRCFELREDRVVWLNVEPRFVNLRNDYRFQDITQKMRLT